MSEARDRTRSRIARLRATRGGRIALGVFAACFRFRVTGLAAEAAFFAILSLPPLIFGLAGAVGFVAQRFDVATIANFRTDVLALAARFLTADAVSDVIAPTLDNVLTTGQFSVVSIGFVIAVWSGSRALSVMIDTITIMYGLAGRRSIVRTRALSVLLYLGFLITGVVLLPLVLVGPDLLYRLLPDSLDILVAAYWPVVSVGTVCFLASLFHFAVPVRVRWRAEVPGAAITFLLWVLGSALLRWFLTASSGSTSIYGPLAAPIAVLIWLYLTSLSVLIGAAVNAALDTEWPALAGAAQSRVGPTPVSPESPDPPEPAPVPRRAVSSDG